MKILLALLLAAAPAPAESPSIVVPDQFRLVGIDCGGYFMSYDEEDEFPVACEAIMPIEDYCSTDSGVEDPFCVGYRPFELGSN
jgi:hypothetical protein